MAKILFVDDDPVTLELMGQAAKLLGHQALLAKSGIEALKVIHSELPQLVFLDMMMPGKNGLDVLREVRATPAVKTTPIIILSAGSSTDDAIICDNAGADGYLSKPIPLQTLMDTIHHYTP